MSEDVVLRNLVANIAAAYFRTNHVAASDIQTVIREITISLSAVGATAPELSPEPPVQTKLTAVQIRNSITQDALISFEDHHPYKMLRRHLAARGLSPEQYRKKWGLPDDYPMTAPGYRDARARLAEAHGFGAALIVGAAEKAPTALREPESKVARAGPPPAGGAAVARITKPFGLARKAARTPPAFCPIASVDDLETSSRHKRWLAMLSEADWARIRAAARQVNHAHAPPALTDLTAPLRIRACLAGHETRFPGEHVGTLRGGQVAVLISERDEH